MSDYTPISCDLYDQFEIVAVHQDWIRLDLDAHQSILTKIKTLTTRDKKEFAVLLDESEVRLDRIRAIKTIRREDGILGFLLDKIEYNHEANLRIIDVIGSSTDQEANIRLMSHIINAQDIWNKRMLEESDHFDVWQDHPVQDWGVLLKTTYGDTIRAINVNSIGKAIRFKDTKGSSYQLLTEEIIFHIINHGTYHRGQIIRNLQMSNEATVSTDYFRHVLFWK